MNPRTNTPDRVNADGSRTLTTKRCCNGCGQKLGDITNAEMAAAINGRPLPDVRRECPACGPTAPEPACYPMTLVAGDMLCLDYECGHHIGAGDYCDEVSEETACATHTRTEFPDGRGEIVHAEPWPCQHSKQAVS